MSPSSPRPGPSTKAAGALTAILAALLIYSELLAFGGDMGMPAAVGAVAQMALGAVALLLLGPSESPAFFGALLLPLGILALALAWALYAAAAGAPVAADGVELEIVKFVGVMAMVPLGALIGRRRERLDVFAMAVAVLGLAYTLLSLILAKADPYHVWGYPKGAHAFRFTGTLINANAAGCAFGMIALVSLGALISLLRRTPLREVKPLPLLRLLAVGAGALAALGACAFTASRASLAGAVLLGALVAAFAVKGQARPHPAVLLGGAVAAALIAALGLSQVAWRWDTVREDAAQRGAAYAHYLALAQGHPLYGVGLGGFRTLNQAALTPADAPYLWDYGAAHSAVLQAWIEGGWPFAALVLAAISALAAPMVGAAFGKGVGYQVGGVAAAAALAGLCSSDDIALNTPAVAALAALLLGAAFGATAASRSRRTEAPSPAPGAVHS